MMLPSSTLLDLQSGVFHEGGQRLERRLSHMRGFFADSAELERLLSSEGDRLVYEVYAPALPEAEGHVLYCTTVIHPGCVGQEFHMTKGHFHAKRDRAEVYLGLSGQGMVLMQTEDGQVQAVSMTPGVAAYIPPCWAHRTVNTGSVPFVFFSAWPGDAGHDYATIEQRGFAQLVVNRNGEAALTDNPRYRS